MANERRCDGAGRCHDDCRKESRAQCGACTTVVGADAAASRSITRAAAPARLKGRNHELLVVESVAANLLVGMVSDIEAIASGASV